MVAPSSPLLRLGTRASRLARWQADHVAGRLRAAGHPVEIVLVSTLGDRVLDQPLAEIGDKGLFTQELDAGLLDGSLDLAVHSLKDLPTTLPDGLTLAAVASREEPWDAFVAHPDYDGGLDGLPEGAIIGTSSLRRQAQLLARRPDLRITPVRGNVPTRLAKLDASGAPGEGGWHGLVLAAAGLVRLDLGHRITERLAPPVMIPAVSQGALGIVTKGGAPAEAVVRDVLEDETARRATTAERALLRRLEGGCQVPVAAHAVVRNGSVHLEANVVALDGSATAHGSRDGADPEALGVALAEALLAEGADAILAAIRNRA